MDILERITELRKERNWSVYKLADEAGLTQSTLANMFTRKRICDNIKASKQAEDKMKRICIIYTGGTIGMERGENGY